MRSALVDYFRERGKIMIATEAGAEGINLQFCAMVVNYDLPWNPQRIEQRIGRCHRYGQKHDVVVVNFLNQKNEADQRVYRKLLSRRSFSYSRACSAQATKCWVLLKQASTLKKRIAGIYQQCRQTGEIKAAFDQLQYELTLEINEAMTHARQKLLDNFDDEVREKLKVRNADTNLHLNQFEQQLMRLAKHELNEAADFIDSSSFRLNTLPDWIVGTSIPTGLYELPRRSGDAHFFRVNHPLGEAIVSRARSRELPAAEIIFDYTHHVGRISQIEPLIGKSGWLAASLLSVDALGQSEDHLLLSGVGDDGAPLANEVTSRLMTIGGSVAGEASAQQGVSSVLADALLAQQAKIRRDISERNARFFEAEADKLDGWADDLKVGLERELKELDRQRSKGSAARGHHLRRRLEWINWRSGRKRSRRLRWSVLQNAAHYSTHKIRIDEQRTELMLRSKENWSKRSMCSRSSQIRWRVQ